MKGSRPGSHRSPFCRDPAARRMSLQVRDQAILASVAEYGLLSLDGIRTLASFGSRERAAVRTRLLFDHGYLDRRFVPTIRGSAKVLYVLGAAGVEIVAARLGQDVAEVRRRRKAALEIREAALPHCLQVAEIRRILSVALAKTAATRLDRWVGSADLARIFRGRLFLPDGYFRYWHRDKLYACFLEVDLGTESHPRLLKKTSQYLRYGLTGAYRKDFGLRFFRVLLVAPTEARRAHLQTTIERTTDKMFWLAVISEVRPETALGPIWTRPHRTGRFSLVEL